MKLDYTSSGRGQAGAGGWLARAVCTCGRRENRRRHVMAIMSWRWRRPWSCLGVSLSAERSSLLVRSFFSGREFFFMDFLSFGDPSRRCSRSSSRRWGCGDSCRRWHSADSTGLRRDPEYQLPRRLRRAADFGGGALGGRRTRPVLLSIGAKSSSARGGAVAAHFLVPNLRSRIQTGLTYTRGSTLPLGPVMQKNPWVRPRDQGSKPPWPYHAP